MELSTSAPLLISPSCPVPTVFAGRLPQPTRLPLARSRRFRHASGTTRPSDSSTSVPSHFALAYRVGCRGATRGPAEVSQGHALVFRTVPSAYTLVRWVDESAFASIVQARPCPTFGRPVRHGVAPSTTARYCSANPSDPTSRWAPCPPQFRRGGSRSTLAVSGFRLRARVGVSITCHLRPARHYPRLWIRPPSSGDRRDLNPPDHCAAWRTLRASPPPSPARPDPHGLSVGTVPRRRQGFPCCVHSPLPCVPPPIPRRNRPVLPSLASRPVAAFPVLWAGRLPHATFRGLLGVLCAVLGYAL